MGAAATADKVPNHSMGIAMIMMCVSAEMVTEMDNTKISNAKTMIDYIKSKYGKVSKSANQRALSTPMKVMIACLETLVKIVNY
jgi:hypothetical protein